MRSRVPRLTAGLVVLVTVASCTSVGQVLDDPDPRSIAEDFAVAWNAEDFEAMNELFVGANKQKWHSGALRVFWERVQEEGMIESFEVAITEATASPQDDASGEETVGYSITYESEAASDPITFSGQLALFQNDEEWVTEWRPHLPWPGYKRATGFDVVEAWMRRGTIWDRDRNKLAAGNYENRSYPNGSVGGTTVGHLEPPAKNEEVSGRFVGASGLEAAFDKRLAGKPRLKLVLRSGKNIIKRWGPLPGRPGKDVRTTLDVDIQAAAEAAFGSTPGGAVVLDPRSGDVLAAVSSSPFDPGNYVGVADIEPFNRALSGLYPPGSSLKAMTASAALDSGTIKPDSQLTGPKEFRGVRNFESGEFGTIDFATALRYSVNTAFAQVALKLGTNRLFRYAQEFGFNSAPKMALHAATPSFPKPLDEGDLMWGSIGQAQVLATPLQMATVAATVANDGVRMEPRIDMSVKPSGHRAIKIKTAHTMQELMRNVVIGGTGTAANVAGLDVAGKTGTAEVDVGGERKNHAWFICFAPNTDARVAIAVVSEYGGVGGEVAAPLARNILTSVYPQLPTDRGRKKR